MFELEVGCPRDIRRPLRINQRRVTVGPRAIPESCAAYFRFRRRVTARATATPPAPAPISSSVAGSGTVLTLRGLSSLSDLSCLSDAACPTVPASTARTTAVAQTRSLMRRHLFDGGDQMNAPCEILAVHDCLHSVITTSVVRSSRHEASQVERASCQSEKVLRGEFSAFTRERSWRSETSFDCRCSPRRLEMMSVHGSFF
jgi:hypothetical protein